MKLLQVYAAGNALNENITDRPTLKLFQNRSLPSTGQEFNSYIDQLLTPDEQLACNMATD